MPNIYKLEPERAAMHGHFSRDLPPVLTIDPGDTVIYRVLDAGWGLEPHPAERTKNAANSRAAIRCWITDTA